MGRSPPEPGLIDVDVDVDVDEMLNASGSPGVRASCPRAFGELDFGVDLDAFDASQGEEQIPPSSSRSRIVASAKTGLHTRETARAMASVHEESTRVVHGDALSSLSLPPPALDPVSQSPVGVAHPQDEEQTRAWSTAPEDLSAASTSPECRPSSFGPNAAPSASGVSTPDDTVAAMRDLYAKGDAEGALAIGVQLRQSVGPPALRNGGDYPDASVFVEFGDVEVEVEVGEMNDPYGGLVPLEGLLASSDPASAAAPPPAAPPLLSLTERQSVPRILKSAGEVAKLPIDHRAGFLLAHVDGMQTLEEILDVCAMPPTEALHLIGKLTQMGVIEFE